MKWRILMGAVALAAAAWSGWWFVGRAAHETALRDWLAARRAAGWQAEAAGISTVGFPNRFDTTISGLSLADTANGWAWSAPFVKIVTLSYKPGQALVALPGEQVVAVPGARAVVRSEKMEASARFSPDASLALGSASIEIGDLSVEAQGWSAGADAVEAHLRQSPGEAAADHAYDLYLAADNVLAPDFLSGFLAEAGGLPPVFDHFSADATVTLDRPVDRAAIEVAPPGIRALSLKSMEARWGDLKLSAAGDLRAGAGGYAEGKLDVRAENWRAMLRAATAAGALDRNIADVVETALGFVARLRGDGEVIDTPLTFADGRIWIGPAPLARAPRLTTPQRQ